MNIQLTVFNFTLTNSAVHITTEKKHESFYYNLTVLEITAKYTTNKTTMY